MIYLGLIGISAFVTLLVVASMVNEYMDHKINQYGETLLEYQETGLRAVETKTEEHL